MTVSHLRYWRNAIKALLDGISSLEAPTITSSGRKIVSKSSPLGNAIIASGMSHNAVSSANADMSDIELIAADVDYKELYRLILIWVDDYSSQMALSEFLRGVYGQTKAD
jgi:hypothetical protein